jgi:hypothetical protein
MGIGDNRRDNVIAVLVRPIVTPFLFPITAKKAMGYFAKMQDRCHWNWLKG